MVFNRPRIRRAKLIRVAFSYLAPRVSLAIYLYLYEHRMCGPEIDVQLNCSKVSLICIHWAQAPNPPDFVFPEASSCSGMCRWAVKASFSSLEIKG